MKKYLDQQQRKAEKLIQFIRNDQVCRSQQILAYFGETFHTTCGICDVCITNKQRKNSEDLSALLLSLFTKNTPLSKDEIIDRVDASEESILIHLRNLLRRDILGLTDDNKLFLK